MGWVRMDDDMLDHPKWRRALRDGGDGALLVWQRLTAWCSRRLTDGVVPGDMVDDVAELGRSKGRARALQALVDAQLLGWAEPHECTLEARRGRAECAPRARRAHDVLIVVGYLERNPTAASVRENRERRAEGQRNRRLGGIVTGHAPASPPIGVPERGRVPSRPGPLLSPKSSFTRDPDRGEPAPWWRVYPEHADVARRRGHDLEGCARAFERERGLDRFEQRPCDLYRPFLEYLERAPVAPQAVNE